MDALYLWFNAISESPNESIWLEISLARELPRNTARSKGAGASRIDLRAPFHHRFRSTPWHSASGALLVLQPGADAPIGNLASLRPSKENEP